jgi:hypothetical protein
VRRSSSSKNNSRWASNDPFLCGTYGWIGMCCLLFAAVRRFTKRHLIGLSLCVRHRGGLLCCYYNRSTSADLHLVCILCFTLDPFFSRLLPRWANPSASSLSHRRDARSTTCVPSVPSIQQGASCWHHFVFACARSPHRLPPQTIIPSRTHVGLDFSGM